MRWGQWSLVIGGWRQDGDSVTRMTGVLVITVWSSLGSVPIAKKKEKKKRNGLLKKMILPVHCHVEQIK